VTEIRDKREIKRDNNKREIMQIRGSGLSEVTLPKDNKR
jgi:hypothetical protein